MELKEEQVGLLLQFIIDQKAENDKKTTPAKKATGIIFTIINLIAFFVTCAITIGYGISSYNKTVDTVGSFDVRMKNVETKLTRIDSLTNRIDQKVDDLLKK